MGLISNARINSTCYIFSNASNASSSVMNIKSITLIPGVFISIVTLILAGIILMALKEAKFYSSSVLQLYFNLTVTDACMAVVGIFLFLQPGDADFGIYQNIAIVTQILRISWQMTVVHLMINRYRLIQGHSGVGVFKTRILILATWVWASFLALLYYLLTPGAPLDALTNSITGAILNNILTILNISPIILVLIYLVLIVYKTRKRVSKLLDSEDDQTRKIEVAESVDSGLRVLYAFSIVYLLGYGLTLVVGINDLLNLSGYVDLVKRWKGDPGFCQFELMFYEASNLIINLLNSLIIVQSKMVRGSLKQMYTKASSVLKGSSTRGEHQRLLKNYQLASSTQNEQI